jgi:hypothetical protein
MNYPKWVPASIVGRLAEYAEVKRSGRIWETFNIEFDIWHRLATRPEMEPVWDFIVKCVPADELTTNGGLTGNIDRAVRYFHTSPRLSPPDYKKEMLEIAKLADALSLKLRKFCEADTVYNPFPYHSIFNSEQLDITAQRQKEPISSRRDRGLFRYKLDYCVPLLDVQLKGLANRAKTEAEDQAYRLALPRKVNDENLFRTYFVKKIGDYFFLHCADYSPSRLAIFCGVALDDPDITPDLVRKLYPLDDECRTMLEAQRAFLRAED